MKFLFFTVFSFVLMQPLALQANFSGEPAAAETSAKHAKMRAKLRANTRKGDDINTLSDSNADSYNGVSQQVNINGADGCNLNVGNVLIDDTVRNAPDEVIVIIEGDIIQSNNCR